MAPALVAHCSPFHSPAWFQREGQQKLVEERTAGYGSTVDVAAPEPPLAPLLGE